MPSTRQRSKRRTGPSSEPVWVIDLAAAEAQRAMQPIQVVARRRWDAWLASAAAAVWAYDVVAVVVQVRR
jgi:hypothetical protein